MTSRKRGQNEGSIRRRRDGRWEARLSLGWNAGRRVRKSFYGETRREVAEQLTDALRDRKKGLPLPTQKLTMQVYLDQWLRDSVRNSVRPRTYERYESLVRLHIVPVIGKIRLEKLTPQHVQQLLNLKLKEGLSPKSVRHLRGVIRTALARAAKWELVARNVASLVDPPKMEPREVRPMPQTEARRFLDAAKGERFESLYLLALTLGLRRGEVLGLQWADVDFDLAILRVNKALQRVAGRLELAETKTKRSRRSLPLPGATVTALRTHRARQAQDRLLAGAEWRDSGFIFTTSVGTPLDPANVLHDFKRILKKAGLPPRRFHDLRHSAASFALAGGTHPRVVMEMLGHSQISLTMDTYSHIFEPALREALEGVASALGRDRVASAS